MEEAREILDQVCGFLDADELGYSVREDAPVIDTAYRGDSAYFKVVIFVRGDVLAGYVRSLLIVPEDRRKEVAEAITRANTSVLIGGFKLDLSDGDLGFGVSMPIADSTLTHEQFRELLGSAFCAVDRYHRAFCRLLYGDDLSPAEVIAEVEMAN